MDDNDKKRGETRIEIPDIEGIVTTNLGKLMRSNSKDIQDQYTRRRKEEIDTITANIEEFEAAIEAIKSMLAIYQSEYNDSIMTIEEFDGKIKYAQKMNDLEKVEEMTLVREYYTAKIMIINNEIELKNTRITLIEKMIEFLKIKLKNITVYMQ